MCDKTIQERIIVKRRTLESKCTYGVTHFCDGTPNLSADGVDENTQPKGRCPDWFRCEIRKHSVFEERSYDE